jgi:hypothetical protein
VGGRPAFLERGARDRRGPSALAPTGRTLASPWRCGSRCQATETTGHRPSRASDVHLRDARKQRESSIGQRGPTPQLQRVVEQAPRRRRIAPDARRARLTDERLETARVDCVGLYRQPISRRHRLQYRTGVTERAPRRDAVTRSLRIASAGAARGHSDSATDSADTGCGARTVNKVNSARCLPAGSQTRAPFTCASSDPGSRSAAPSPRPTLRPLTPAVSAMQERRNCERRWCRASKPPPPRGDHSAAPQPHRPHPQVRASGAARLVVAQEHAAVALVAICQPGDASRSRPASSSHGIQPGVVSLRLSASWPRSCSSLTAYGTSFSVGMRASAAARGCKRGLGEGSGDAYERLA